jgi:mannose-1-phosphate guanylyltransferase
MKIINVILSGGVGSRLWPLSRKARPKQYLPIFDGHTLFQKTVLRNKKFCDQVMVVGNSENFELSRKDLASAQIEDYSEIIEASPRNTAAAIAFAAFKADAADILFVTPSDHLIQAEDMYASSVSKAVQLAKDGYIVTFGLKPFKPETGFGYIEADGEDVKSFREKPDAATAQRTRGIFIGTQECSAFRQESTWTSFRDLSRTYLMLPRKHSRQLPTES